MITNKQFSNRMVTMDFITMVGFGSVYPIILRAYQENLVLFWLTLEGFIEFGCGWLINRLLEYPKIKQRVFKIVPLVFITCIILDILSIYTFIHNRNYAILLLVDLICTASQMWVNDAFNEITNCMFEKTELSDFHRRDRKYAYRASACAKGLAMLIAGIVIKDNVVSVSTMIVLQVIVLIAEIVADYGYYKYLYLPCKSKVFETWNEEKNV